MSNNSEYQSTTIKEVIYQINKEMFLPSIQRSFIWKDEQITRLFDSIMRGYPIGTFLFWEINTEILNKEEYILYKFIEKYDEIMASKNKELPIPYIADKPNKNVTAVLDGQQRLNSLYLALQGTIKRKGRGPQSNNKPKLEKELYFNLHSNSAPTEELEDDVNMYEFKFFSKQEFEEINTQNGDSKLEGALWFRVKDILKYDEPGDLITKIAMKHNPPFIADSLAINNLDRLHARLVRERVINYFCAKAKHDENNQKFTTLDEVTDIFVRINSGGTKLTKADLLFSRIVSVWEEARKEFEDLIQELNTRFKFNNDFIIKSCLMAINRGSKIKAELLTKKNILEIRTKWDDIKKSILDIRRFLEESGIFHEFIDSYNSLLPLVLFRYLYGYCFDGKSNQEQNRRNFLEMKKFIVVSQLNHLFGGSSNSLLDRIQNKLYRLNNPVFPDFRIFFDGNKEFILDRNMIRTWFNFEKGKSTFAILTLLYGSCRYGEHVFEQDHMHPASSFKKKGYEKYSKNKLANLQILSKDENQYKSDMPLKEWLSEYKGEVKYLPKCSLELADFEEFMQKRQELMEDELCRIFGVK